MRRWLFLLALPALAQKLTVLPPSVELSGPEARAIFEKDGFIILGTH